MFSTTMDLMLTPHDREILTGMLRATTLSAGLARRARVILLLADGHLYAQIAAAHGVADAYIARWKQRVVAGGSLLRSGAAIAWIRASKRRSSLGRRSR